MISRRRLVAMLLVVFGAYPIFHGLAVLFDFQFVTWFSFEDFKAYYAAALRAQMSPALYEPWLYVDLFPGDTAEEWLYPPLAVLLFLPFVELPLYPAAILWTLGSLAVLVCTMWYLTLSLGVTLTPARAVGIAVVTIGFFPTVRWALLGQITGLLTAGVALSLALSVQSSPTDSDRPWLIGGLFMLVAFIKPYYLAAGTHLLARRRRLIAAGCVGGLLYGGSILVFGISAHIDYLGILLDGKGFAWGGGSQFATWRFTPFHAFGRFSILIHGLIAVTILLTAVYAAATSQFTRRVAVLGSIAVPLIVPTANTITLSLALPGLYVLLIDDLQNGRVPLLSAVSLLVLHFNRRLIRLLSIIGENLGITDLLLIVHPATVILLVMVGTIVTQVFQKQTQTKRSEALV